MMRSQSRTIISIVLATAAGFGLGWLLGRTPAWSTVGAVIGIATGAMILVAGVRPLVAIPVAIGAGVGAYVGGTIVGVLCDPTGCPALEVAAASLTGFGALVGIGLVVALATRSFDEYREAADRPSHRPDRTDEAESASD